MSALRKTQPVPSELDAYYMPTGSFSSYEEVFVKPISAYTVRRYILQSNHGEITIDYFDRRDLKSDRVVLVFPILGGQNKIENYFADVLVRNGIEAAIVHRNDEFKDPYLFAKIEGVMQKNIKRDRVALDFFENILAKKVFGGFGLSRGAMNLVITAGIDKRLSVNFFALGGADLATVVGTSQERRIIDYVEKLASKRHEKAKDTISYLQQNLKTQPYRFAQYIDPKKSLLLLGLFDSTVPIVEGMRLRQLLGNPTTIYLVSGHTTALVYSQYFRLLAFGNHTPILPFPYIESKLVGFFKKMLRL
jgi:hypothetical protein